MAKRWYMAMWFQHSGLSKTGAVRDSLYYHRTALGHASGAEITLDITWQGKNQAHLFVGSMSQGAKLIDDNGGFRLQHTEVA